MSDCFVSWSGGKDCCLALYRAKRMGLVPRRFLTMLVEDGLRSRSHGLPEAVLRAQAAAAGAEIEFVPTTWDDYEEKFIAAAERLAREGLATGVFGDIDGQRNRDWVEMACAKAGVSPVEPLWAAPRRELLAEFIDAGFAARVVVARADLLEESFLGRPVDWKLVEDLEARGLDASGENGEYHTAVTGGPVFARAVELREASRSLRGDCWFLEVDLKDQERQ